MRFTVLYTQAAGMNPVRLFDVEADSEEEAEIKTHGIITDGTAQSKIRIEHDPRIAARAAKLAAIHGFKSVDAENVVLRVIRMNENYVIGQHTDEVVLALWFCLQEDAADCGWSDGDVLKAISAALDAMYGV